MADQERQQGAEVEAADELAEVLGDAPEKGSADELLDAGAEDELGAMRHSAAHVMAEAVLELFPGARLGIGPAIDDGFYYDFDLPRPLTPEDLAAIEERMAASVAADHPFVRREVPFEEARALVERAGQSLKVEILDDLAARADAEGSLPPVTSFYEHGPFTDLCKGPHVASTGRIGPFKLLAVAGAYWRGDEHRPMLQRVYGTVWPDQDELDRFLWRREEARKRDHRRLGVQLDLYSFSDLSPGSPFWHPKGQRIWRTLEASMRELQDRRGYQEVATPMVVSQRLWEQSGHWDLYRDNMFLIESEGQTFSLKPMNCPESTVIYRSRLRSYRDLPLRLADYGRLHRNERSGTLSGLTRVRQFTQDDAHIYVRPDQLGDEIAALLGEVQEVFGWFGLEPELKFGTKPDKALGDPALWERAEALILEALDRAGLPWTLKPKDGAFYAPKIDIHVEDALGRSWQTATIQVDLVMLPERFDLTYVDDHGQAQRPIAIHRAIYGSLERFIAILVEHFGGAFPLWLAPVQAVVIPIADRHVEPAERLADLLRDHGLRAD
ncbi:MAG TPA: threonine--tRNA ligase, partial [Candidatus Limnocylindrales bacterium]|nr:threonine--tRNA ligase [Candidatus Limnocylindrales bacterium]